MFENKYVLIRWTGNKWIKLCSNSVRPLYWGQTDDISTCYMTGWDSWVYSYAHEERMLLKKAMNRLFDRFSHRDLTSATKPV